MKKYRIPLFYIITMSIFAGLIYFFFFEGKTLESSHTIIETANGGSSWENFKESFSHNLTHPLALLLIQIVVIILIARAFGWICSKIGQPTVVGEMLAGIALGPSLLGMYFPEISAQLFPDASLGNLQFLSQIGLILFMFIVGMELDLSILRKKVADALVVSHASIIAPFALGIGLSYFLYDQFAPEGTHFVGFALFISVAMSITAFPVLARIVQERNLQKTRLGTIVIACAAIDDISAWCILAAVIAIVKAGSFESSLFVIATAAIYVFFMFKVVKPFLKRMGDVQLGRRVLSKPIVALFFLVLILSSYITEVIGIHALFGAFMAGAMMPENIKFRNLFIEKIEDVAMVLLLPLFFVFTGLRTQIGLLNEPHLWVTAGIIILVAVSGKFFGGALTARFVGIGWKDSLSIGTLMNTRGLMELIVLNIGFDLGVLGPEIFAMMVIMAIFTTFMTGPLLDLINFIFKSKEEESLVKSSIEEGSNQYRILISFDRPKSGATLLRLANNFTQLSKDEENVTVMNVAPVDEIRSYDAEEYETEQFREVVETSKELKVEVTTLFKPTTDRERDILDMASKGGYDLMLTMLKQSMYQGSILGKVLGFTTKLIDPLRIYDTVTGKATLFNTSHFDDLTDDIIDRANFPVGVMIDKNFVSADNVFLPIFNTNDLFLFGYAKRLIINNNSNVKIFSIVNKPNDKAELDEIIGKINDIAPRHIEIMKETPLNKDFLDNQDLMLISLESWTKLLQANDGWISNAPSTLIIRKP